MVSDVPHTEIPDDAVFYAENVVFTKDGNISNRGPIYDNFTSGAANRPANGGAYQSIGYANTPEQNAAAATYITPSEWPTGVVVLPWTGGSKNGGTSTRILFETFNATPRSGLYSTISTWDSEYSDFEDNAVSTTIPIGIVPGSSVGKSFDYFGNAGFPVGTQPFPVQENYDFSEYEQVGQTGVVVYAGYPNGGDNTVAPEYGYYLSAGTASITAGSSTLTLTTPTWSPVLSVASYIVGKWIYITDGTNEYLGRVVRSKNNTDYEISPTPTKSIIDNGSAGDMTRVSNYVCPWGWGIETGGGAIPTYAASGCVHQQRVVLACTEPRKYTTVEPYVSKANIGVAFYYGMLTQSDGSQFPVKDRVNTICWSALRDDTSTAAVSTVDGEIPLLRGGWPKSQYITLDTLGISSVVSIDANNLLVLCIDKVFLISGELGTILPNNNINQSSFNVRLLTSSYTCWSDKTVQVTPYGVFFADDKGIYLTDGAKFVSVLQNRSRDFWQEFCQKVTFAGQEAEVEVEGVTEAVSVVAPTGSAFVNGSYFIWFGAVQGGEGATTIVTPTKYGFQVQADANFAFSIVTTELTYNSERYPSFGYSIAVPDTGKVLTHSITANRGLSNTKMDVPNLDKLRNPTIDPFDCTTGVSGGLGIYSKVITKAASFSNGVNARLRKSLVSYISKAGTYPTNSGGIEITTATNYIDRWSWNVSGYNIDQTIAPTTYVAPVIEDSQVRIDYVPNSLPDNAATNTNPNISSSFYMTITSRGNNFTVRDVALLYNEMRLGKLNR